MGDQSSDHLISLLVKAVQAYCSGHIQFSYCVEVIGHIHLNIDRSVKVDYVLSEEVSKVGDDSGPSFCSHSYLSQPPAHTSQPLQVGRESHSSSSHGSIQTQQLPNSGVGSVITTVSQTVPGDGTRSFAVSTGGHGETPVASDQVRVTVSFDGGSAVPLIKQETSMPPGPLMDRPGLEENGNPAGNLLRTYKLATPLSMSPVHNQQTLPYRQENRRTPISFSQENTQSADSDLQGHGQSAPAYSQNSQPGMAAVENTSQLPMIQIQDVCSESVQLSSQPAVCVDLHMHKNHSATSQTNSQTGRPPSKDVDQPEVGYSLPGNGLSLSSPPTEENSLSSQQPRKAPASSDYQSPACGLNCAADTGADCAFENLCLDVVMVKEEVTDEVDASHGDSYTVDSQQGMHKMGLSRQQGLEGRQWPWSHTAQKCLPQEKKTGSLRQYADSFSTHRLCNQLQPGREAEGAGQYWQRTRGEKSCCREQYCSHRANLRAKRRAEGAAAYTPVVAVTPDVGGAKEQADRAIENRRARWRELKRKERASWSPQQWSQYREKNLRRYYLRKERQRVSHSACESRPATSVVLKTEDGGEVQAAQWGRPVHASHQVTTFTPDSSTVVSFSHWN